MSATCAHDVDIDESCEDCDASEAARVAEVATARRELAAAVEALAEYARVVVGYQVDAEQTAATLAAVEALGWRAVSDLGTAQTSARAWKALARRSRRDLGRALRVAAKLSTRASAARADRDEARRERDALETYGDEQRRRAKAAEKAGAAERARAEAEAALSSARQRLDAYEPSAIEAAVFAVCDPMHIDGQPIEQVQALGAVYRDTCEVLDAERRWRAEAEAAIAQANATCETNILARLEAEAAAGVLRGALEYAREWLVEHCTEACFCALHGWPVGTCNWCRVLAALSSTGRAADGAPDAKETR